MVEEVHQQCFAIELVVGDSELEERVVLELPGSMRGGRWSYQRIDDRDEALREDLVVVQDEFLPGGLLRLEDLAECEGAFEAEVVARQVQAERVEEEVAREGGELVVGETELDLGC